MVAVRDDGFAGLASPNIFSAKAGVLFSGPIGFFQDGNNLAGALDTGGAKEFIVAINWGDGTSQDLKNLAVTVQTPCGVTSGTGAGEGCIVALNGSHTYHAVQVYNVIGTFQDGSGGLHGFTSTAYVTTNRTAIGPAPAAPSSGRSPIRQSPAGTPGPRVPARLSSGPTRPITGHGTYE